MAKVMGLVPLSTHAARRPSVLRRLLSRIAGGRRRPSRLYAEQWSEHMLRDVGLSSLTEPPAGDRPMPWPGRY